VENGGTKLGPSEETALAASEHSGQDNSGDEDNANADADLSLRFGLNSPSPEIGRGLSGASEPLPFNVAPEANVVPRDVSIWSESAVSGLQESTVISPVATGEPGVNMARQLGGQHEH
jgi:hypothetical protein